MISSLSMISSSVLHWWSSWCDSSSSSSSSSIVMMLILPSVLLLEERSCFFGCQKRVPYVGVQNHVNVRSNIVVIVLHVLWLVV